MQPDHHSRDSASSDESHLDAATSTATNASAPARPSPYFLEKLQEIRHGDAVSGSVWTQAPNVSRRQAITLAHIDRATMGLETVLSLLQASETCRRRRPEDFGIGDDRHEGLLYAARELVHGMRDRVDALEARWLRER